jgi:hypothetical protein
MPSLLTSPALLTEKPEPSLAAMPLRIKPFKPLRLDQLKIEFAIIFLDFYCDEVCFRSYSFAWKKAGGSSVIS